MIKYFASSEQAILTVWSGRPGAASAGRFGNI